MAGKLFATTISQMGLIGDWRPNLHCNCWGSIQASSERTELGLGLVLVEV